MLIRALDTQNGQVNFQLPSPPAGATVLGGAPANQAVIMALVNTVAADPTANEDTADGYTAGSVIYNNTAGQLRFWMCLDATVAAAKWAFIGADYTNGGTSPATGGSAFGGGTAVMGAGGTINRQISSTGVQPGATAADNVLAVYSIPASSFSASGRGVNIMAAGSFAATNNAKRVKIIFNPSAAVVGSTVTGGTTIADTGALTTTSNNVPWFLSGDVYKYGAAASNTQITIPRLSIFGATTPAIVTPTLITATESGAILVAVTGNATTATTDITFNFLEVNARN